MTKSHAEFDEKTKVVTLAELVVAGGLECNSADVLSLHVDATNNGTTGNPIDTSWDRDVDFLSTSIDVSVFPALTTSIMESFLVEMEEKSFLRGLLMTLEFAGAEKKELRRLCGLYLAKGIMRRNGIQALLLDFADTQSGYDTSQISHIASIISRPPSHLKDLQEYYAAICPQLVEIIKLPSSLDFAVLTATSASISLLTRNPKLGREFIIGSLLKSFSNFFDSGKKLKSSPDGVTLDLDGRIILVNEDEIHEVCLCLQRLLLSSESSQLLADMLARARLLYSSACFPIYGLAEMNATSVASETISSRELLKSIMRLVSTKSLEKLLVDMATLSWTNADVPRAVIGPNGRPMFVLVHEEEGNFVQHVNFFIEFLVYLGNMDAVSALFLALLEKYSREGSGSLHLSGMLLQIMTLFADEDCILLALALGKNVLDENSAAETIIASDVFQELLIIVQVLQNHELETVRALVSELRQSIAKIRNIQMDANLPDKAKTVNSLDVYRTAMEELTDELLPLRAHGMGSLRQLVLDKDPVAANNLTSILTIFLHMMEDEDSFIYLNALKGLSALTDSYPKKTLVEVMSRYTDTKLKVESRLRLGEAILQTIQRYGDALAVYSEDIVPSILQVMRDTRTSLRASAVSLLSSIMEKAIYLVLSYIHQVLDYLTSLLAVETDMQCRRSAVLALLGLFQNPRAYEALPGGVTKTVIRTLKGICETDQDEITRGHASHALEAIKNHFLSLK
ncbi:transmembrane and coiled-coil domains-containing protein 7 [Blyttiomyces sp. JEL0837]|nr:transmembrane and coiled-coil domains-containing protein 7 [Blyttiomyces sp. JEL0837]